MSQLSNRAISSIFGCPNASETSVVSIVGPSGYLALESNEVYRMICTTDCFISIDTAQSTLGTASGVRIIPTIPEMFCTTGDHIHLNTLQDSVGGADTGLLTVTKMLTRGV